MDASIRIKVSELNTALLERIKALFQGKEDAELTISFNDAEYKYYNTLAHSKSELEQHNNLISFTMEELETYTISNKKEA